MKRFFSGILVGLLLSFLFINVIADDQLRLIVNGKDITTSAEPILHNGKTYTPARAVAEALGATVEWDASTNTVSVSSGNSQPTQLQDPYHVDGYLRGQEFYNADYADIIDCVVHRGTEFLIYKKPVVEDPAEPLKDEDVIFELKSYRFKNFAYASEAEFKEKYSAYLESIGK